MNKQSVFHPILNFWTSSWLLIISPKIFFKSYEIFSLPKRLAFLFGLLHMVLAGIIGLMGFQVQMSYLEATVGVNALPAFMSSVWVMGFLTFVTVPVAYLFQLVIGSVLFLIMGAITRTEFTFRSAFNLLAALAPFALANTLASMGLLAVFDVSLLQSILGICFALLFMVLWFRSFHEGALVALSDQLVLDARALIRFYFGIVAATAIMMGVFVLVALLIVLL